MPIFSDDVFDEPDKCRHFYVHVQFLPWESCQADVRNFFDEFEIMTGGILIHGPSAFVAFKDRDTAEDAVRRRDETMFSGCPVHLSVIDREAVHNIILRNSRRKLKFESRQQRVDNSILPYIVSQRKKLRPTRMYGTRATVSFSNFPPEEVDMTVVPCEEKDRCFVVGSKQQEGSRSRTKKIHPTIIRDGYNCKNYPVFHPEKCFEIKKIRANNSL